MSMSTTTSFSTPPRQVLRPTRPWPFFSSASYAGLRPLHAGNKPKAPPPELESDTEEGLALPVEPDEGTALIPDDERVINVPS